MAKAGERRLRIDNTVAKMLGLDSERFSEFNFGVENVPAAIVKLQSLRMIEIHIFTEDRFPIDTFVVDGDLVFAYFILNYHLARPNADHLSNLFPVDPPYMDL